MKFRVKFIHFDFGDDDFELPPTMQEEVIEETFSTIWEADDEEDLVEEITAATGFCINSIDYEHVLT